MLCYSLFDNYEVRVCENEVNIVSFKRILPTILTKKSQAGYEYVFVNGKLKSVHRLVAIAVFGDKGSKFVVNHKDGNKLNNNPNNLEWATHKENTLHAISLGNHPASNPEKHGNFKGGISKDKKKYKAEYYKNNKEIINRQNQAYHEKNRERMNALGREWYHKNKEEINMRRKAERLRKLSLHVDNDKLAKLVAKGR